MELTLAAIVALLLGCVIGFVLGKASSKNSASNQEEREKRYQESLEEKERGFQRLLSEREKGFSERMKDREDTFSKAADEREKSYRESLSEKERSYAEALAAQERNNALMMEALQKRFDETVAKMQEELQNVTNRMLKERQSEFESSSREGVSRILAPLQDNIRQMKEEVVKNTRQQVEAGGRFDESIRNLLTQSEAARKSADRLADALRHGGKIQGNWGETVLTELLESQGLKEGIHFDTQTAMTDASGHAILSESNSRLIPDVILHLDKTRDVIIDAKVSLTAYLDYMNSETEEVRNNALKAHVDSIQKHVRELAAKDYSSYVQPPKTRMGYVIMFIPNSAALFLATNANPDLWRRAMEQNVYIADEQTLYAALKIINMTWVQISQAENHEKVFALADEMLKRVGQFMDKFVGIEKALKDAQKRYDEAFAKLDDRGQSIPVTCRKLINLGAKQEKKKGIPDELLGLTPEPSSEIDKI